MKLKIDTFNGFDVQRKNDLLCEAGQFLTLIDLGEIEVYLYHLKDFYVEIHLCHSSMEITQYRTFTSTKELEPFLESIDLRGMMI